MKSNPLPLILIGGAIALVLLAIVGIVVGLSILRSPKINLIPPTPTPTPVPTTIEILPNPNPKYASDAKLLEIRNNLRSLNQEISTTNFFEPQISPPNIDLNISID